jgi:predicted P-loop ATPase
MMAEIDTPPPPALVAALEYARAGWPVLPLDGGMSPIEHEPSADRTTLIRAWTRHPEAYPGVVLGHPIGGSRLHLVALVDHGGEAATAYLTARGAIEHLGLGHLTHGSVRAWLFASPVPIQSRELAPGLEVRGDGVLPLPPSNTARAEWRWRKGKFFPDRPLIAAPHWLRIAEPEPAPAPGAPVVQNNWHDELVRAKNGAVQASLANTTTILRCDARYAGRLAYDEMALVVGLDGKPLDDAQVVGLREQIERRYGCQISDRLIRDALLAVGASRRAHPVRQYLRGLKWDGVGRLDRLAADALHTPDPLAASLVRKTLVAAVARALTPGCKVDTCLVLVGPQGLLKSSFFRVLAGDWFADTHLDLSNKDAYQQIAAAWIYELGEIDSITSRKHAADVKRFMTSATDTFRPPFERSVRVVPRSGIMVGSTNRDRFLTDDTGSRRFWIVRPRARIDLERLARQRDQLWAEAVAAHAAGERWWLDDAEEDARAADAEQHAEQDPWRDLVVRHFAQQYREGKLRGDYTAAEIATDVLKLERRDLGKGVEQRIGDVLRGLGLDRRKARLERGGVRLAPTWTWFLPESQPLWILTEPTEASDDAEL